MPFHPDYQCSFYEGWFEQVWGLSLNGMAWEDFKLTPQPCIHLSPIPQSIPCLCLSPSPLPPAAPPAFVLPFTSFTADSGLSDMTLPGPCFTALRSSSQLGLRSYLHHCTPSLPVLLTCHPVTLRLNSHTSVLLHMPGLLCTDTPSTRFRCLLQDQGQGTSLSNPNLDSPLLRLPQPLTRPCPGIYFTAVALGLSVLVTWRCACGVNE